MVNTKFSVVITSDGSQGEAGGCVESINGIGKFCFLKCVVGSQVVPFISRIYNF